MPCAPLDNWEGPSDWTIGSTPVAPRYATEYDEAAVITSTSSDLERAYRRTLQENGLSTGENASLFDHMRAIGLLPQH